MSSLAQEVITSEEWRSARSVPVGTTWLTKTVQEILDDFNTLTAVVWKDAPPPDSMLIPYKYLYSTPIRFRVTGKRPHRRGALRREFERQRRGLAVRRSVFYGG